MFSTLSCGPLPVLETLPLKVWISQIELFHSGGWYKNVDGWVTWHEFILPSLPFPGQPVCFKTKASFLSFFENQRIISELTFKIRGSFLSFIHNGNGGGTYPFYIIGSKDWVCKRWTCITSALKSGCASSFTTPVSKPKHYVVLRVIH